MSTATITDHQRKVAIAGVAVVFLLIFTVMVPMWGKLGDLFVSALP